MKNLLTATLLIFATTTATAGVAETKAANAGNEEIATQVAAYTKACGKTIKVVSKHADAGKMKIAGEDRTPDNMIGVAATGCGEVVSVLAYLCADKDYKAEIVKLTTLKCVPSATDKPAVWKITKAGNVMTVNHYVVRSYYTEGIDEMKKAF